MECNLPAFLSSNASINLFHHFSFRNFQIRIVSSGNTVHQGLLTNDFQVFVVSGKGEKKKVKISLDRFFTGVLDNEKLQPSEVFGYLDQNGDAFLTINTPKETYSVEVCPKKEPIKTLISLIFNFFSHSINFKMTPRGLAIT